MNIVQRFNNLDGKSVGRRSLERIAKAAKEIGNADIYKRLSRVLDENPEVMVFDIKIDKKATEAKGLGQPNFKNLKEAKKYYLDWAFKNLIGKKVYHNEINKWVVFNYKGVSHSINSFLDLDRISLITQAEKMVENSKLIEFQKDYRKRRNIKGAYKMESAATLKGKNIAVILILREGNNGVIYYDHKIDEKYFEDFIERLEKENSNKPSTPTRTKKTCVADQPKRVSQDKDTKNNKTNKLGLGVPITPQLRKKIFRPNGRLKKGYHYDNDGFLTDGKQFFVDYTKGYDAFQEQVAKSQKKAKEKAEELEKEDKRKFTESEKQSQKKQKNPPKKATIKQQVQINADKLLVEELQEKGFLRRPIFFDLKEVKERIKRIKENTGVEIAYAKSDDAYHLASKDYNPQLALFGGLGVTKLPDVEIQILEDKDETPEQSSQEVKPTVPAVANSEITQPEIATPQKPLPKRNIKTLADRMREFNNKPHVYYEIDSPDLLELLGNIEKKEKESVVITIAGSQGSMKTRFAFQFINAMAKNYRVGHASIEEHPDSTLYYEKAEQYISPENMANIENPEVNSITELDKLIKRNDVIIIDSFAKLQEIDSKFEVDKDLRKKYNGKLFLVVFQQTSDGKMRGGSKSQFDGDIILMVQKEDDYTNNFVYNDKNRYNKIPLNELHYNIHSQMTYNPEVQIMNDDEEEYKLVV